MIGHHHGAILVLREIAYIGNMLCLAHPAHDTSFKADQHACVLSDAVGELDGPRCKAFALDLELVDAVQAEVAVILAQATIAMQQPRLVEEDKVEGFDISGGDAIAVLGVIMEVDNL